MEALFLFEGSVLNANDTVSVINPGVAVLPVDERVEFINQAGKAIGTGTVKDSFTIQFDHLGGTHLLDNTHPEMRHWTNAIEFLTKNVPEFGMADMVTLNRVKVDSVFQAAVEPTVEFTEADEEAEGVDDFPESMRLEDEEED